MAGIRRALHAARVNPVETLRRPVDTADVAQRRGAHPHREIGRMRQLRVVTPDRPLNRGPQHDLGIHDAVASGAAPPLDPVAPRPDGPASQPSRRLREIVLEDKRVSVDDPHRRMGLHQRRCPGQGARSQRVVGGKQHHVVSLGPLEALVVRGDVAAIALVQNRTDPLIARRQRARHRRRPVRRGIVDDDDVDTDAVLAQRGADCGGQIVPVVVTRDDDRHAGAARQRLRGEATAHGLSRPL